MTRRSFLKFLTLSAAATVLPPSIAWGSEQLIANEDSIANLALLAEVNMGNFSRDKMTKIDSLDSLHRRISQSVETLGGISSCHVCIADGEKRSFVRHHIDSNVYLPASTIKIPICYEAWKLGKRNNVQYLTPDLAEDILGKSYTFINLLMKTPYAAGKTPEQLSEIVEELLINADIPPANPSGILPLKVNIMKQFEYLIHMNMPQVMKDAMLQDGKKGDKNYGVSKVLLQNLDTHVSSYFKLGLIYDENARSKELVNSYYFQIGENVKVLGYAKGSDKHNVHKHMLQTAQMIGNYVSNK